MPKRVPKYSLHKATGQARVVLDGQHHYLGPHGSDESKRRYRELINRWKLRHDNPEMARITIGELVILYDDHASSYYRKDGKPTSTIHAIRLALRPLVSMFSKTRVAEFGPAKLIAVRQKMIEAGRERKSINSSVGKIVQMFRWGVEQELCPSEIASALSCVSGLKKGRSNATESQSVKPVALNRVEVVKPHLAIPLQGAVDFQLATASRPGEALQLRLRDIDRSGDVWLYRPDSHKTAHHEKDRVILCGPKAQAVILEHADSADPDAYVFAVPGSNGTKPYRRDNYTLAVRRSCETEFNMPKELRNLRRDSDPELKELAKEWRKENVWSPNQLRHSAATEIRKAAGSVEFAKTILGHSSIDIAELYAERDLQAAAEIVKKIG